MHPRIRTAVAIAAGLLAAHPLSAQGPIKIGTIAPQNSIYVKTLHQMGEGWKSRTNGRVTYTILAGGDESEEGLLRNMRPNFRKLHAAQLSAITLANLDDAFNVFGLPMFFESYAEADRVLEKLSPVLEQRLEAKGYKALNWAVRRVDSHLQQDSRHHGRRSQAAQVVHVDWRRPPGAVVQEERLHRRPDRQHGDHHVAQDLDDRGRSVPATLRPAPHLVPVGALHDGPRVCSPLRCDRHVHRAVERTLCRGPGHRRRRGPEGGCAAPHRCSTPRPGSH